MYTKKIKYTDFNENEREEEFLFNLNTSELTKWLATDGDYTADKLIAKVTTDRNGKKTLEMFEDLIKLAYGEKSLDGRTFDKSEEIYNKFRYTPAYDKFFMELISDENAAINFICGVVPSEIGKEIQKELSEGTLEVLGTDFLKTSQPAIENQENTTAQPTA